MTPAAIWRKVDLPEPFRPTNPTRSPSRMVAVALSNTIWLPKPTTSSLALATEFKTGSDIVLHYTPERPPRRRTGHSAFLFDDKAEIAPAAPLVVSRMSSVQVTPD